MSRSKKYLALKEKIDIDKTYSVEEGMKLVKETAQSNFDSSIEIHLRLGIDPKKGEQQVRGTVVLPHGIGKKIKVAVFAEGDDAKEAKGADADFVYSEEDINELKKTGKIEFDIAVAPPSMMKKLAVIAKMLGQKGLMPSPKNETVTPNVAKAVKELKGGKIAFKNDDTGNLHQLIGKASFDETKLIENYRSFMKAVADSKPDGIKGIFIKTAYLTSTMGPSVKVELK
ncbi:MAG TPA: 50S ribosomal protein L1 [Candidatus Bipolaricaulota bacterium]|nr:50S ribosomal protein L1 [Candidatus Bipolaricaulota bacterium]